MSETAEQPNVAMPQEPRFEFEWEFVSRTVAELRAVRRGRLRVSFALAKVELDGGFKLAMNADNRRDNLAAYPGLMFTMRCGNVVSEASDWNEIKKLAEREAWLLIEALYNDCRVHPVRET